MEQINSEVSSSISDDISFSSSLYVFSSTNAQVILTLVLFSSDEGEPLSLPDFKHLSLKKGTRLSFQSGGTPMVRGEDVSSPQQPRFRLPSDLGSSWFDHKKKKRSDNLTIITFYRRRED